MLNYFLSEEKDVDLKAEEYEFTTELLYGKGLFTTLENFYQNWEQAVKETQDAYLISI